jgi:hypothetical protein
MTVMLQDGTEEEPKNKESDIMEGSPFNWFFTVYI